MMRASRLRRAGFFALLVSSIACQGADPGQPGGMNDMNGMNGMDGEGDGNGECTGTECPDDPPPAVPTAFRVDQLRLLDPHVYASFLCIDATHDLDMEVAEQLGADGNGDGELDLSVLAVFRPLDQAMASTPVEISSGRCTAGASTSCTADPATRVPTSAARQGEGVCMEALDGTTGYGIDVGTTPAPCFRTEPEAISLSFGDIQIELEDGRLAATYVGDPATRLDDGIARGFLPESVADGILLPADLPLVGGQPLSSVLPGGNGNCASDERDVGPDGSTMGWYVYLAFSAVPVTLAE